MPKPLYTPKALDDLQEIKSYVSKQFGKDRAKICAREIATTVRQLKMFPDEGAEACVRDILSTIKQLEMFPDEGLDLGNIIEYPTDYHYLVIKPNYIFYRIEGNDYLGLAVFLKKVKTIGAIRGIHR